MAKDPAFLFYPGDWLGGTMTFNRAHKGAYMDLLMAQFNQGCLSQQDVKDVLGSDYEPMWESKLKAKFKQDENRNFYNEKLLAEQKKRKDFTQSRRKNLEHKGDHVKDHTGTRMENEDVNVNIDERKNEFINKVAVFKEKYSRDLLIEFCHYWMEHNENGKKMKFEKQDTFNIGMRLQTWKRNNDKFNKGKSNGQKRSTGSLDSETLNRLHKEHFARFS